MRTLAILLLGCGVCWGQTTDECQPSTLNIPGAQYPCVHPDRRATFRLEAPEARTVQVRVGKDFDMLKGSDGVWSLTTTPLVEGFHYYSLVVDGVTMADPAARTFFGSGWENSAIEIPEPPEVDYYLPKDVPHGQVSQRRYHSAVTGKWRRCYVYTPPDYDAANNVYFESPGTAHEWLTWRRCLNDFAPRLFK